MLSYTKANRKSTDDLMRPQVFPVSYLRLQEPYRQIAPGIGSMNVSAASLPLQIQQKNVPDRIHGCTCLSSIICYSKDLFAKH